MKKCQSTDIEILRGMMMKIGIDIDDQLANCTKLSEAGIKLIRITEYTDNHGDIINKKNWNEIYNYIKETLN